jgi:F420-dependent oxidoreductase-like protein
MRLRLGVQLHHSRDLQGAVDVAVAAERLGYDTVWAPEAWGSDAVSMLAFIAARTSTIRLGAGVMQMAGRTPANTAMSAMSLDELSGGRLVLGLGTSGPQVVEGWHGVPFDKPLGRSREYVEIVRRAVRREEALRFSGKHYEVPLGDAPALKSTMHPRRTEIPIWLAANGPKNIALAAEIADGWLPSMYSPDHEDVFDEPLAAGTARRDPARAPLEIATSIQAVVGADLDACRDATRAHFGLYIGGMGSREHNFYKDIVTRYGYGEAAARVQDLYLSGRKDEALRAIPVELIDELALVGPPAKVADRLKVWEASRLTELILRTSDVTMLEAVRAVAGDL